MLLACQLRRFQRPAPLMGDFTRIRLACQQLFSYIKFPIITKRRRFYHNNPLLVKQFFSINADLFEGFPDEYNDQVKGRLTSQQTC